ncbi:MAG: type II secretion system GspH family protein [Elusimicrobiales bacterium]|nr:type II secretion system GspH family protein [Elusimicrobiales bacterium]
MILIIKKKAFTLIELLVVILIISILLTVAYVKTNSLTVKSKENVLKYNISALRSVLSVYYHENGFFPQDPIYYAKSVLGKTFFLNIPFHGDISDFVILNSTGIVLDTGKLAYVNITTSPLYGYIFIDCFHKDSNGEYFYKY